MKHQCPKCQREYDAELNFCPQCGEPSKASLKSFTKEPANKNEAASGSSVSNVTSHMNEFFPPNPSQVESLLNTEGGLRTVKASHNQKTVKDSEPVQDASRCSKEDAVSSSLSPLASDAAYHRSFRTLSRTIIIGNAFTALSVIGFALIFTFSQQRQWNMSQERLMVVIEKLMATNDNLTAKLEQANTKAEQSNARVEKSDAAISELQQKYSNLEQKNAATLDSLREVMDKVAEQRIAALPTRLTNRESSDGARNLSGISAKIENTRAKRTVEALKQRFINKEDRASLYKDYLRVLPNLDAQVRADMEHKVGKLLLGD